MNILSKLKTGDKCNFFYLVLLNALLHSFKKMNQIQK
jgi:hypothetical protein